MNGRIPTCIEAHFQSGGRSGTGTIKNVSEGGLYVRATAIPEEGESLDLRFRLPGRGEVKLTGLVWWTRCEGNGGRGGFGLRILDESRELRELLESA